MGGSGNGGPHDHPGRYKLINIDFEHPPLDDIHKQLDAAEDHGYEFLSMNNRFILLYKDLTK